jgi:hypothetical protein
MCHIAMRAEEPSTALKSENSRSSAFIRMVAWQRTFDSPHLQVLRITARHFAHLQQKLDMFRLMDPFREK